MTPAPPQPDCTAAGTDTGTGTLTLPVEVCGRCAEPWTGAALFCGQCGHRRDAESPTRADAAPGEGGEIGMLLWLYGISLTILVAASIYDRISDDGFGADLGSTTALFLLFGAFALGHRSLVAQPLSRLGFSGRGYLAIGLFSLPILAVVHFYVEAVVGLFKLHLPGEIEHLVGHHWIWAVLLMAILPPLSEELGFRGLIYGGLRRSLSVGETFLVSSFAFAMLHLSIPMLLTHFPLGLYFCWLRHRSGSLWPPIFAHACHNFGVVVLAWTTET